MSTHSQATRLYVWSRRLQVAFALSSIGMLLGVVPLFLRGLSACEVVQKPLLCSLTIVWTLLLVLVSTHALCVIADDYIQSPLLRVQVKFGVSVLNGMAALLAVSVLGLYMAGYQA